MERKIVTITCRGCGFSAPRGNLDRQCSNCFACTGCEVYLCPECGEEIVVKPIGVPRKRNTDSVQKQTE